MSQENVEVVRGLAEGWHRGDLDAAYSVFDPRIEWDATPMAEVIPDIAEVFHGHEGVRTFWRRWLSAWKDLQFEVQDVLDAGDEVVLLIRNQRQWGRHSGIATEVPAYAHVYTFQGGKVVRWRCFPNQDSALEAVGLSEQAMPQENVELVRTVLAGWARGDFRAGSDLFHAHFEWKQRPDAVEPGSRRGASVGTALRQLFEVWENYRIEAEEYIDAGDRIVVVGRARGTARWSRLELDQNLFFLWTARDGKLASLEVFRDRAKALEAMGLSQQDEMGASAMSEENVEVVRRIYAAVADHDASRVRALYDPEVEVDSSRLPEASLEGGALARGYEGIRSMFRDWSQAWESFEDHCDEVIDAGEYVVSLVTRRGRGRASGVDAVAPRAGVWTIRDGKVIRVVWYPTHEEALEAVGLSEQAMPQENVETTRIAFEALNQRDFETFLGFVDPEVEVVPLSGVLEGTRFHGHDGVRTWWKDLLRVFPDFVWDLVSASDVGPATIAEVRVRGAGVASDVPFEETVWVAINWRNDKVAAWQACRTKAEALEAVGLSE